MSRSIKRPSTIWPIARPPIAIISGPNRPEYIVSTRQPGPFADDSRAFWQVVGQYYERVVTIDDVPIYRDKTAIDAEDD
jgi:hypothetical protein